MREISLKKRIFMLWLCVVVVAGFTVFLYTVRYARTIEENKMADTQLLCDSYAERLENDLHMMQEQINWYFTSDLCYRQVSEGISDDLGNIRALAHIKNNLTIQASVLDFEGGYFFYNRKRNDLRSSFHNMESVKTLQINQRLKEFYQEAAEHGSDLFFFSMENDTYILSSLSLKGCQIGYLINLTNYFQTDNSTQVIYLNGKEIIDNTSQIENNFKDFNVMVNNTDVQVKGTKLVARSPIMNIHDLTLIMVRDYSRTIAFWKQYDFLLVVAVIAILVFLFSLFFYHTMNQTLLIPVQHILLRVNEMKEEKDNEEILSSKLIHKKQIKEYREINSKIDQMFLEMRELEEERVRERVRANEAQLQYYQLQTDPHFYLNCLNTISTLLHNGKKEVANDMIIALSGHFRYMFRKSRSLVCLKEEIGEVQDYCRIFNIRNGVPLLLDMDISEDNELCEIPLLCIQTFVENSIKYYGKNGQMLQIRIQVRRKTETNGQEFLKIRITDNGVGYTKENLDEFNKPVDKLIYKSSHVGIDNLKYRFKLIYEDTANIYFYNAPYSGAAVEMTIPVNNEVNNEFTNN